MNAIRGLTPDEVDLLIGEQRGLRGEPIPGHGRLGAGGHERVQEQGRRQRSVRDQPRIPFDLGDVGVVVMDAV